MVWDTITEQQFLEELDTSPQFRDEVRRRVLSAELIAMPENLAKTSAQLAELSKEFGTFASEQKTTNAELRSDVEELKESNTEIKQTLKRIEASVGELKGNAAYWVALSRYDEIPQILNLEFVHILSRAELVKMAGAFGANEFTSGDRHSFYRADLIMEATEVQDPKTTRYVAVEASYTGDHRDTDRARRNAEILKRCTGHEALAIVASVRNDREILPVIDAGTVTWYRLSPNDFRAQ